jgi:hypothetical protein
MVPLNTDLVVVLSGIERKSFVSSSRLCLSFGLSGPMELGKTSAGSDYEH